MTNPDTLAAIEAALREPRTLSQFAGPHHMATVLVEEREQIAARIAALRQQQGQEWVRVPRECTREMRLAGAAAAEFWIGGDRWHLQVDGDEDEWPDVKPALSLAWDAMLAAAPSPEDSP